MNKVRHVWDIYLSAEGKTYVKTFGMSFTPSAGMRISGIVKKEPDGGWDIYGIRFDMEDGKFHVIVDVGRWKPPVWLNKEDLGEDWEPHEAEHRKG